MLRCRNGWSIDARVFALVVIVLSGALLCAPRRRDIALEYRLIDADGRWAVYDVAVEGVSLVSSYRSQFHSILRNSSFAELLARLRSREVASKPEQGQ